MENPEHSWTVRVGSAGPDRARILIRKQAMEVGAPLQFDYEYPAVTALEQLLGALGADLVNGLRLLARRRRLEIEQVEARIEGWLNNPLVFLGVVGETGHPGLERVEVRLYVSTFHSQAEVAALFEQVRQRSVVLHTLEPTVKIAIAVKTVL